MTDQENQNIKSANEIDKLGTINYIYEMALSLKLMAAKVNEPLLFFLLEVVEKESLLKFQNYNEMLNQKSGASDTKPPE
ncbi:hypothetical protein [Bartonella sp. HY406]|uniref:hypothetical protein n=1 Tax=Bartonella sp. HY406 TaxID=2979331 RepID=UPI0021C6DEA2|nr:hypothetical protein [Bartonella sp. HY406]UXN04354.1 hypothetical protein N6B01_04850 [Bartonella sp. HY406]